MWPAMEIATRRVVHKYKGRRLVLKREDSLKLISTWEEGRRREGKGEGARLRGAGKPAEPHLEIMAINQLWQWCCDHDDKYNLKRRESNIGLFQNGDEIKANEGKTRASIPGGFLQQSHIHLFYNVIFKSLYTEQCIICIAIALQYYFNSKLLCRQHESAIQGQFVFLKDRSIATKMTIMLNPHEKKRSGNDHWFEKSLCKKKTGPQP